MVKPCEFAYRVRRFNYSKLFCKFKDKGDRKEGAMFDVDVKVRGEFEGEFVSGFVDWDDDDICLLKNLSFDVTG